MTFKEFLQEGLVKDDDKILILKPICGTVYNVRGSRYPDQILELQNMEVVEVSWSKKKGWKILLAKIEVPNPSFR